MFNNLVNTVRPKHLMVFQTEQYMDIMNTPSQMQDSLARLTKALQKNELIFVVHNEHMSFHKTFNKDFIKIVKDNQEKIMVLAEGEDNKFPFPYSQHNNYCIEIQMVNRDLQRIDHSVKNKDFLIYLGRDDIDRIDLIKGMEKKDLLKNSFVSANSPDNNCLYHIEDDIQGYEDNPRELCLIAHEPHFRHSKLSVVLETNSNDKSYQLSEKIYKPLMAEHPFVVFGPPGYLKYMRAQGYRTFDKWIDESYDQEPNNHRRIEKIVQCCQDFIEVDTKDFYDQTAEVRQHNRHTFFAKRSIPIELPISVLSGWFMGADRISIQRHVDTSDRNPKLTNNHDTGVSGK